MEEDGYRVVFCDLHRSDLAHLEREVRRHTYGRHDVMTGPTREEGALCVIEKGEIELYVALRDGHEMTVGYRASGEAFELHEVETPLRGQLRARAVTKSAIVATLPWASFAQAVDPTVVAFVDRQLYRAWHRDRQLLEAVAPYVTQHPVSLQKNRRVK